jgi:heme-degrading monooxygenase HmoA
LNIKPGQADAFEAAFDKARHIIGSMPGFAGLRLMRCLENQQRYLLLVEWRHLEDHTEGFRDSPAYRQWRDLLHHFYDPFPNVEHYDLVSEVA